MSIETLDDIVEEIMDRLGIYGAHEDDEEERPCRCCASAELTNRIRRAAEIEARLSTYFGQLTS